MSCVYYGRRLFAVSEMLFIFDRPLDSQVRFGVDDVVIFYLFIYFINVIDAYKFLQDNFYIGYSYENNYVCMSVVYNGINIALVPVAGED